MVYLPQPFCLYIVVHEGLGIVAIVVLVLCDMHCTVSK